MKKLFIFLFLSSIAQAANEINAFAPGVTTAYSVVREADGDVWYIVGDTFEVWGTGARTAADYDIALTGKSGNMFVGDMDTDIGAGSYHIATHYQVAGAPADTDPVVWQEYGYWTGSVWTLGPDAADIDAILTDTNELQTDWTDAGRLDVILDSTLSGVSNLANVGAAVNTTAKDADDGFVINTGTNEGNDEDSTHALDGTNHTIDSTGNELDVYYEFTVGGDGVPVSVVITGYLNGNNDDLEVHAYNWSTPGWDQVGDLEGKALTINEVYAYNLFTSHVGTGSDLGTVRIRFTDGAYTLTSATLTVDQIYVSYSVVARSVGYADGAIWVDTGLSPGNTNTESYVDGTADNPVSTWAAALTLSGNLNLDRFHIAAGSSITLTGNSDNYELLGWEWTLDLGSQSLAGAYINGAAVTGTMTGTAARFFFCKMGQGGTATLSACGMKECAIAGSIVLTSAGTYLFDGCFSGIAGTSTPDIDFGSGVGDTALNMRHYSGGIEIKNMNTTGTDTMSLEGFGQLVLNANCAGGTIAIRGHFTVTDNASGAVTLSQEAAFHHNTIIDDIKYKTDLITILDTTVATPNDANTFILTDGIAVDNALNFSLIIVEDADDSHYEARWVSIWESDKELIVDRPFGFTPAAGDVVHIMGTSYGGWLKWISNHINVAPEVFDYRAGAGGGTTTLNADDEDP